MRILYLASKFDYGKPERGPSFEHCNLFDTLHRLGHDILYFDPLQLLQRLGRAAMNRRLLEVVRAQAPDLLFAVLYRNELQKRAIRAISDAGQTTTLNWFCDDQWRFENYSRLWAPCFNWVVTTAQSALPKYQAMGYDHAIKSQWACNHFSYRKLDLPLRYDVTFVGQPHGNRRLVVRALRDAGIAVQAWGNGWEAGRLSQDEMIAVFNQSRINLNLSNPSVRKMSRTQRIVDTALGNAGRLLNHTPGGQPAKRFIKQTLGMGEHTVAADHDPLAQPDPLNQIKGRNFEIPGCGGFMLTSPSENLDDYFIPDREYVAYANLRELIDKIRYYLAHEEDRARIAHAGHARTLDQHTYAHRFHEIFNRMNLPAKLANPPSPDGEKPGSVEEIT